MTSNKEFAEKLFDSIQDELEYDFDAICGDQKDDILDLFASWTQDIRRDTKSSLINFLNSQEI